jgi:hypothetical protein
VIPVLRGPIPSLDPRDWRSAAVETIIVYPGRRIPPGEEAYLVGWQATDADPDYSILPGDLLILDLRAEQREGSLVAILVPGHPPRFARLVRQQGFWSLVDHRGNLISPLTATITIARVTELRRQP